jgi:hypothetical protein
MSLNILVIVPTKDRLEFLAGAVNSLERQTRRADETVIIGNVGAGPHFQYSEDTLAGRLNSTISRSRCDAFIILSDDDLLDPTYIERTEQEMERTGADIIYTSIQHFGEFNHVTRNNEPVTALCRKTAWKSAGGYAEVPFFDWDFWWSCREAGARSVFLNEPLFLYRRTKEQLARHARDEANGMNKRCSELIESRHPKRGKL